MPWKQLFGPMSSEKCVPFEKCVPCLPAGQINNEKKVTRTKRQGFAVGAHPGKGLIDVSHQPLAHKQNLCAAASPQH